MDIIEIMYVVRERFYGVIHYYSNRVMLDLDYR